MKYGLFCSEFSTDHFPGLGFLISDPTYAKIGKNWLKIAKNPIKNLNFRENGQFFEKTKVTMKLEIEFWFRKSPF